MKIRRYQENGVWYYDFKDAIRLNEHILATIIVLMVGFGSAVINYSLAIGVLVVGLISIAISFINQLAKHEEYQIGEQN